MWLNKIGVAVFYSSEMGLCANNQLWRKHHELEDKEATRVNRELHHPKFFFIPFAVPASNIPKLGHELVFRLRTDIDDIVSVT